VLDQAATWFGHANAPPSFVIALPKKEARHHAALVSIV